MDSIGGRYRIIRQLGQGGTGTVYGAVDSLLGRSVAIKALHEAFPAHVLRYEAQVQAGLDHPGVVALHDLIEEKGRSYLVMEWIDGCDLAAWIRDRGSIDPDTALGLFRRIAGVVADAHRAGVLHCDLKPSNVLLSIHGDVKLSDFTMAWAAHIEWSRPASGGTDGYSAPEVLHGASVDARTDVFSLGAILRDLLAHCTREGESSPQLPAVIARAMASDPQSRYETVEALLAALPRHEDDVTRIAARSHAAALTRIMPRSEQSVPETETHTRRGVGALAAGLSAVALLSAAVFTRFPVAASPARVTLPNLVSTQNASARLVARSLQLRYRVSYAYSPVVASGVVMEQRPKPNTQEDKGSVVSVVVSKGPAPIAVPDVSQLQQTTAIAQLQAAGFVVQTRTQDSLPDPSGTVLSQTPSARSMVLPHTAIVLTVSTKPWWDVLGW